MAQPRMPIVPWYRADPLDPETVKRQNLTIDLERVSAATLLCRDRIADLGRCHPELANETDYRDMVDSMSSLTEEMASLMERFTTKEQRGYVLLDGTFGG